MKKKFKWIKPEETYSGIPKKAFWNAVSDMIKPKVKSKAIK